MKPFHQRMPLLKSAPGFARLSLRRQAKAPDAETVVVDVACLKGAGYSEERVRSTLGKLGYSEDDIVAAVSANFPPPEPPPEA